MRVLVRRRTNRVMTDYELLIRSRSISIGPTFSLPAFGWVRSLPLACGVCRDKQPVQPIPFLSSLRNSTTTRLLDLRRVAVLDRVLSRAANTPPRRNNSRFLKERRCENRIQREAFSGETRIAVMDSVDCRESFPEILGNADLAAVPTRADVVRRPGKKHNGLRVNDPERIKFR